MLFAVACQSLKVTTLWRDCQCINLSKIQIFILSNTASNACYIYKLQGGLTANVKWHFLKDKYTLYDFPKLNILACQTHPALVKKCHVVRMFCQF